MTVITVAAHLYDSHYSGSTFAAYGRTDGLTDSQRDLTKLLILSTRNFTKTPKTVHFRDRIFSLLLAVHFIETQLLQPNCDTGCSELYHRQKAKLN